MDVIALTRQLLAFNTCNPPVIILGPGDLARIHKTDEFCLVSKIEAAAEAYYQIMLKWSNDSG